jgi:valyl-tRNA synthetase
MSLDAALEKTYDSGAVETKWYEAWEAGGHFKPNPSKDGRTFTITIPPPNVTGELHMGHALQHAIHDTVIRWKRMEGFETLCLPGTDHAGIGTQAKVEEQLFKESGKSRHDISREEMLERIWAWREKYGDTILQQLKELGCSYDWSRTRFTMDEGYQRAVLETFVRFYEKGWIYRGRRIVNWCPQCESVISDLEVDEIETNGHLWHIRYPGVDGAPDVVVATTRPETMLGDTGVAVHPSDERWQDAVAKRVTVPLVGREVPIVADDVADPEMGSGAVKVTPSHDPNDYEIGQRHDLPEIQVIGEDGKMTEAAGEYAGLDRYACRKAVVAALEAGGYLVKIDDHAHAVPQHDRCSTVIEPLAKEQWFVSMRDLADQALPFLGEDGVQYVPDRFRNYTVDWLDNIRDWCISRQIWWGHRIPAWTHKESGEVYVGMEPPENVSDYDQDPDVLDTWFSSALWPFATMGWPDRTEDLARYHPTDLMITGRDILYLWVVRMVMTAVEFEDMIPFKTVLVHPTVQTRDGKRMSKSLGTGIDPRELIGRYGADATRLSLLYQCGSSQDIRFDAEVKDNVLQDSPVTESCRNFCNKIRNASRFVLMNLSDRDLTDASLSAKPEGVTDLPDRWILSRYNRTVSAVTASLTAFRFDEASRALYEFVWNDYCDWYVELAKVKLNGDDAGARERTQQILSHVIEGTLRLLHPMIPFISEELWQHFPHEGEMLIAAPWPVSDAAQYDDEAEQEILAIQEVIGAVRNIRGTMRIPPGKKGDLSLKVEDTGRQELLESATAYIRELAKIEAITIGPDIERPPAAGTVVLTGVEVYMPLEGLIDLDVERQRQQKELDKLEKALSGIEKKLQNAKFLDNAPAEVVESEKQKQADYATTAGRLKATLASLS